MDLAPSPTQIFTVFFTLTLLLLLAEITKHAVLQSAESKLRDLSSNKALRLLKLLEKSGEFTLSTQLFATLLLAAAASLLLGVFPPLFALFDGWALGAYAKGMAALLLAFVVWYLPLASLGQVLAAKDPTKAALSLWWFAWGLCLLGAPFSWLAALCYKVFAFVFRLGKAGAREGQVEEEIMQLIEDGDSHGSIEDSEREMIQNVFEFNDISVSAVMTHRTDMQAVDLLHYTLGDIVDIATEEGYSRIPVYEKDSDHIVGILYVKDLLVLLQTPSQPVDLKSFLREPLFVPQTANCADVFALLSSKKMQMAIVVDEYGGTAGIVTVEDLVESIVGNIQDEYDDDDLKLTQLTEHTYLVDGSVYLDDLLDHFQLDCDLLDEAEYTVSGYIVEQLGHIPLPEETVVMQLGQLLFEVKEVADNKIAQVVLTLAVEEKL